MKSIYQVVLAKQNMRQMLPREKVPVTLQIHTIAKQLFEIAGWGYFNINTYPYCTKFPTSTYYVLSNGTQWSKGFKYLKYFSFGID